MLGADPSRGRDVRREIGVAPQEIALYLHLTVAENLDVFAALAGISRAGRVSAVARAMDETVCAERAGRTTGEFVEWVASARQFGGGHSP